MASVAQILTDQITKQLENGVIPWRKPWYLTPSYNPFSGTTYKGINRLLLAGLNYDCKLFATRNQLKKADIQYNANANWHIICFFTMIPDKKDKTGKIKRPLMRYSKVCNLSQTTADISKYIKETDASPANVLAYDDIYDNFENRPILTIGANASYTPSSDTVKMPRIGNFESVEAYYSTLYHELIHSTGADNRLKRLSSGNKSTKNYAKEELTAEIGACMLADMVGIDNDYEQSAGYIAHWLAALKNDMFLIVGAASRAEKAMSWIIGDR